MMLDRHIGINSIPFFSVQTVDCELLLVQVMTGGKNSPLGEWCLQGEAALSLLLVLCDTSVDAHRLVFVVGDIKRGVEYLSSVTDSHLHTLCHATKPMPAQ